MSTRNNGIIGNIDWWLLLVYFILVFFGWINIYSASYNEDHTSIFDFSVESGKQFVWICISIGLGLFLFFFDTKVFQFTSFIIYAAVIVLLVLVLIVGQTVAGNKSWFVITSSIKIQPSEFAKFATALILAKVMGDNKFSFTPSSRFNSVTLFGFDLNISKKWSQAQEMMHSVFVDKKVNPLWQTSSVHHTLYPFHCYQ